MYAAGSGADCARAQRSLADVSAGVLIGFGLSGSSFMVLLAAFKIAATGMALTRLRLRHGCRLVWPVSLLADRGGTDGSDRLQQTLTIFAVTMLAIVPLSIGLVTPEAVEGGGAAPQSLSQALREAFSQRSYLLLVLGFFTCGFQLAFITVHMPSYLVDRGLSAQVGGWTLATIGLFNIVGSVTSGWLGDRMPKRYLLSIIYFVRAAAIFCFIWFP